VAWWAASAVREYRGVAQAREYWSSARGPTGGLLYVALGDSTAQGVGASRPARGYVGLLADDLRQRTGRPVRVVNLSSSGAKVEDVLRDQLPRLRVLRPDVVTVAVGGNDIRSYRADDFRRQVDRLTAALPPGAFIADTPWFMHGRWERHAEQASATVAASAAAHRLVVVPLHQALQDRGWTAMATDFAPDWFHPNDRGYRVWSTAFWSVMSPTIPPQDRSFASGAARPAG
jgi:acyl-CoA thioesterase-1